MKTIKQIAEEIGVSRQAVYKKIKQAPLSTSLQPFTVNSNNAVYITVEGIELIKSTFQIDELSTLSTASVNEPVNLSTNYLGSLQEQIKFLTIQNQELREQNKDLQNVLEREREHSRQQSGKLSDLSQQLAELTRNSQILLKQEQDKTAFLLPDQSQAVSSEPETESEKVKVRLFWQFWKK